MKGCAIAAGLVALVVGLTPAATSARMPVATLRGEVLSANRPLAPGPVSLYRTARAPARPIRLASADTRPDGSFEISYPSQRWPGSVLYLVYGRGPAIRLASALGTAPITTRVVINERTTVAMGFAMAQFVRASAVVGRTPGLTNAAAMARNLVDIRSGAISSVLRAPPNGNQTSTLRSFNSLANMVGPCARSGRCATLFRLARGPRQPAPEGVLAAVSEIARNPWHHVEGLFRLARAAPAAYRPALSASQRPDAWTLALRFEGDGMTMNGPGNLAIDAHGDVWVTGNYTYSRNPLAPVCGSQYLFKFTPTGRYVPGSPYTGGGLSGAGFGITLDPHGNVWVGNFGFASVACANQPPHNSVSEFTATGHPISPGSTATTPGGFTQGGISWPQGTVSDRAGNVWIANCGNNTVTKYSGGDPSAFTPLPDLGIEKPFDIAFNGRGQAFVTGNGNSKVAMLEPNGTAARTPIEGGGLAKPLGIAADSQGNMWVANSRLFDIPCPGMNAAPEAKDGSITLISSHGILSRSAPFTGGGLTLPWGVAVDGHDNVWVANFGRQRLSEFCGTDTARCPPGRHTGQPISPSSGYGFNGLTRNTGVQIDPSGNVWVANNWKNTPDPQANPGGYQVVVFLGAAGPLKTPLIGPPRSL